ncbi:phospholipase A I [Trifolium repens]|nr:phospholipase A I [Trifolium repens]
MLISVPAELRQCVELVELSLEHNKLVRPLLDFMAMAELRALRLFGNPLEFLLEILPLHKLRHLSLANIRIVADENLRSMENNSYFGASRHKLSAAFSLIFRFSSCHHPLLASALGKIMQDQGNRVFVGKDENAVRQLISMISSDNCHVVMWLNKACSALSALASDDSVALQLMKEDIMQPFGIVLKSSGREEVISVLQVVVQLAFAYDILAEKMLTKDVLKSMKSYVRIKIQRQVYSIGAKLALLAVGNLAFCLENCRILVTSESLRGLLLRLAVATEPHQFERLLKEMCADEDGDLLIDSAVKNVPKVFVVSTLVNMMPAQPFIFQNYQYPAGTHEVALAASDSSGIAVREAQLLWPDTKIDCLVSIGCDSVPTKIRKGGWRYMDTGQIHYYRFNPVDERCDMELDEIDPAIWLRLESSVEEYIQQNHLAFENACERLLLPFQHGDKWSENLRTKLPKTKESIEGVSGPTLGWRRNILLVEASHNQDSGRLIHHARALESFCARNGIRLSLMQDGQQGKTVASPPLSPRGLRQFSLPVKALHEKLQNSPQVGVIHLTLQADPDGLIVSWHKPQ